MIIKKIGPYILSAEFPETIQTFCEQLNIDTPYMRPWPVDTSTWCLCAMKKPVVNQWESDNGIWKAYFYT